MGANEQVAAVIPAIELRPGMSFGRRRTVESVAKDFNDVVTVTYTNGMSSQFKADQRCLVWKDPDPPMIEGGVSQTMVVRHRHGEVTVTVWDSDAEDGACVVQIDTTFDRQAEQLRVNVGDGTVWGREYGSPPKWLPTGVHMLPAGGGAGGGGPSRRIIEPGVLCIPEEIISSDPDEFADAFAAEVAKYLATPGFPVDPATLPRVVIVRTGETMAEAMKRDQRERSQDHG